MLCDIHHSIMFMILWLYIYCMFIYAYVCIYTHINIIYIIYIHTQSLCGSILMVLFLFWFDLVLFFEGRSHIVLNVWSVCLHLESAGMKVCLLLPLTQCWGWGPGPIHSRSALHTLSHILSLVLRILKLCFTHGHTLMNVLTLSEMPRHWCSVCVCLSTAFRWEVLMLCTHDLQTSRMPWTAWEDCGWWTGWAEHTAFKHLGTISCY